MLIVALLITTAAQSQIAFFDSREVLLKGYDFYKNGDYKKATEQYALIHECDTNYAIAVYEEVLSLTADSSFQKAKELAKMGLKLQKADKRSMQLALAAAYDYLKQSDSSLAIYDSMKTMYPNDNQAWFEEGIIYFQNKNYDKAITHFQHSLKINPTHFKSNYMLGIVYATQGRLSESMIAFETSLLMTQNADYAKQAIAHINSITEETDEVTKLYHNKAEQYSHPLFDELDQVVNAKLALSTNYKLQMSLNDNIFRQSQVIMEKLKFDPSDTNFVMQFYVPMLVDIYKKDLFESYMLLLFSGYGFEHVDALAKKKGKDIAEVKDITYPYLSRIQETREINYGKREKATSMYHYYPNDDLIVLGITTKVNKENDFIGDVTMFKGNQTLKAAGRFNNEGKKDGWWSYYYPNGAKSSREYYVNGNLRDTLFGYYESGHLAKIITRDLEGEVNAAYEYDNSGWLTTARKKLTGKQVEEKTYYSNGQETVTLVYEGDQLRDGTYKTYYRNGNVKKQFTFKDGKYSGNCKTFYESGKLSEDYNYDNGKLEGSYTAYYESGQVKEKYNNINDKGEGPYEEYYEDGTLAEKGTYSNSKAEEITRYTPSGREYVSMSLKKNVMMKMKSTDEDGNVVYDKEDRKGIFEYPIYYPNGNKSVDMKINEKGEREGLLYFYDNYGTKNDEVFYKEGLPDGKRVTFYKNGHIKDSFYYANSDIDGYDKSYFSNGVVQSEGWYKAGKKQGLWKFYHENGKLRMEEYFLNDELNGFYKKYNWNEELTDKIVYDHGTMMAIVSYDTTAAVADSICIGTGNNVCKLSHWKNKTAHSQFDYNVIYGSTEGLSTTRYMNGGIEDISYYKNGNKDSMSIEYFPDGKVENRGTFSDGDKVGKWEYFNQAGQLTYEGNYNKKGSKDGESKTFACNIMRIRYNYKNGKKNGMQIYYGDEGRAALQLCYEDGELTGYTYEGKDGKLLPMVKIKKGRAKISATYSNGNKAAEVEIEQGMIKGPIRIYFSNGQLAQERNYKDDNLEGAFKIYNPDGKLVYDINYKDDKELGVESTYDKDGKLIISASYYYDELNGPTTVTDPATGKTKTYYYHYGMLTSAGND